MLATIDDNGVYHTAHVIKSWQAPDEAVQTPIVDDAHRCSARRGLQVQYAMEDTTVNGTAVNAADGLGGRQIIAKTGTTSNYLSGFFIGAIPQYAMAVGMFVNQQDSSVGHVGQPAALGGGGFGGFWPANIWNTFAQAEFANLHAAELPAPAVLRPAVEHDRPAAEGEAEEDHAQVHDDGPRQEVPCSRQGLPVDDADSDADEHAADRVPDVPWPADSDADDLHIRDADVNRYWHGHADQHGDWLPRWRARRRRGHRAGGDRGQGGHGRRRGAGGAAAWLAAVDDRVTTTAQARSGARPLAGSLR